MHFSLVLLLSFFHLLILFNCGASGNQKPASYGTIVKYEKAKPVRFADFTIEFTGERRVTLPQYPRGFLYFDFKVKTDSEEQPVSWTSGTGDIAPTEFKISGKTFLLERIHSDKLGKLNENELVIREKSGSASQP